MRVTAARLPFPSCCRSTCCTWSQVSPAHCSRNAVTPLASPRLIALTPLTLPALPLSQFKNPQALRSGLHHDGGGSAPGHGRCLWLQTCRERTDPPLLRVDAATSGSLGPPSWTADRRHRRRPA